MCVVETTIICMRMNKQEQEHQRSSSNSKNFAFAEEIRYTRTYFTLPRELF